MAVKHIKTSDEYNFSEPRIKDLFDKANKNSQNELPAHEFESLINYLTELPIQHNKITYKTLNHILMDTKYDKTIACNLSQIIIKPFNFLNEHRQLLSFAQVMYIVDINSDDEESSIKYSKREVMIAWLYYYFYKKESQFYIPKAKLASDLQKINWQKYNIKISDFVPLLIDVKNTYYTTQQFIDLEKSTGDNIIDHFYREEDDTDATTTGTPDDTDLTEITPEDAIEFTELQRKAIKYAINHPLTLISGFPGTGKSTIIKQIVDYYENQKMYCWLMAPTGKAIKDLKDKCNKTDDKFAGTMHRFIYVTYPQLKNSHLAEDDDFTKNFKATYKKYFEVFVIDEASMISFELFRKIINIVIENNAKLVLVGDKHQLPPIQVGRPFECILNSNIFPTVFLTDIKRTDKPVLSKNIKKFVTTGLSQCDFDKNEMIFMQLTDFSDSNLLNIFTNIHSNYGDFKVITPQHKYDGGVEQCNKILQKMFNSNRRKVCEHFNTIYYVNDVIIQKENDYSRDPPRVNGDVAKIISVNKSFDYRTSKKAVFNCTIEYEDGEKREINTHELKDDFQLFYSATVHKFQGSQENTCVILLSNQHSMWRSPNNTKLFYTAISRAKQRCIIIGDIKVFFNLKYNKSDNFYSKFMQEFNDYNL